MSDHLLPYQKTGAWWLASNPRAVLADDMGLGKTIQAIAAADELKLRRVIVICPAVARINWVREFARFSLYERKFQIVDDKHPGAHPDVSLVMSYERAVLLHKEGYFENQKFGVLILDEGHYLKNPFAKRTAAILGKEGLHRCATRIWALTGTPITKDLGDLWPYMVTFGATKLSYAGFLGAYCVTEPNPKHWAMPKVIGLKPKEMPKLRATLKQICLRRTVAEVLPELPSVTYEDVTVERGEVELSPEDREKIKEQLELLELSAGDLSSQEAVGILELMAQSCSTLRRYLGLQKVKPAIEILKHEMEFYAHKVVVFSHHKSVCLAVAAAFGDQAVMLTGDTPIEVRQSNIDRFQTDETCRIFVASIMAAGTAITLTAAHEAIFIEEDWIPANNDQCVARLRRLGQKYHVRVRTLTVANSIDEAVSRVIRRRRAQISQIIS